MSEADALSSSLWWALCSRLPQAPAEYPTRDDMEALVASAVRESDVAQPCGYLFKNGDIAWICRTCQADDTCVLCQECFTASNHEGHEVFFHRTRAGGCCDCGERRPRAPRGSTR